MDQVKIVDKYKTKEQAQKPILKERNIVLSEYLQHRSTEMELFQNYLEVKDRVSNKMHFQTLGKHLKRRAMSHNRYRVPSRIRKLHDNQFQQQSVGQAQQKQYLLNNNLKGRICRKHLRKPCLLQKLYQYRNQQSKWLDSHLYLTKRMKMQQYYGYQVAITHNTKQNRAAYNQFYKNGGVVYDRSYYQVVEIKGYLDRLSIMLGEEFKEQVRKDEQIQKGQKMFRFSLYDKQQLVAPVQAVVVPLQNINDLIKIWLIVHPCAKQECVSILEREQDNGIEWQDLSDQYNIYDLKGKYVLDKLAALINQISECGSRYQKLVDMFQQIDDVEQYRVNQIYYLNMKGQIQNKIVQQPKYRYEVQSELEQIEDINQLIIDVQTYKQQIDEYDIEVFKKRDSQQFKDMFIKRFITVQRSRYTHRKKWNQQIQTQKKTNDSNKQQIKVKKKIKKVVGKSGVDRQEQKDKEIEEQKIIEDGVYQFGQLKQLVNERSKEMDRQVLLMVMLDNQETENKGLSMIFPVGNGNKIIRYLNYHNCKLVGLNQIQKIQQEAEQLIFPNDYITTQSYKTHIDNKAQKQQEIYDRKPINKRVDYQRLKCLYPFKPDWSIFDVHCLRKVKLKMISRGIPKYNAMICKLEQQDYHEIQQQYQIGEYRTLSHIHQESTVSQNSKMDRQLIGFVTTGDFSFELQKGKGIGFISYQNSQQIDRFLVLIRNTQSRFYFLAEAYIC